MVPLAKLIRLGQDVAGPICYRHLLVLPYLGVLSSPQTSWGWTDGWTDGQMD